jgi:hypothetical protein
MKKMLLVLLLAVVSLCPACKKNKQTDPCKDLIGELPPTQVGFILLDKETGENILLSKNIDPTKITVTPDERVYLVTNNNPQLNGAMLFHIADYEKGAFKYTVNIPDVSSFSLTYTNDEKETGNVCHPTAIVVNDLAVAEYPFTTTTNGNRFIITIKI